MIVLLCLFTVEYVRVFVGDTTQHRFINTLEESCVFITRPEIVYVLVECNYLCLSICIVL